MKASPRPALALFAWVAYVVVFIGLFAALGVDYDQVADSAGNAVKAIVIPVGAAVLLMVALTTKWGWWHEVMRDHPVVGHRWMLVIPVMMACGIVAGLANTAWSDLDAGLVIVLLVGCALVGFGEEILNRGLALVGLRGGLSETQAWLGTCGLFALLHAFNIVVGQSVGATVKQIVFAFLVGSVLYATRRITGLLAGAMVLHGLWDFTSFTASSGSDDAAQSATSGGLVQFAFLVLAVIVALIAVRRLVHTDPRTGQHRASAAPRAGIFSRASADARSGRRSCVSKPRPPAPAPDDVRPPSPTLGLLHAPVSITRRAWRSRSGACPAPSGSPMLPGGVSVRAGGA